MKRTCTRRISTYTGYSDSEACIFLQGSRTRSVFLDFFLEFCEFSTETYISQSTDILMYFYDYNK